MHNTFTSLSLIALICAAVLSFLNKDNLANAKVEGESKQKDFVRLKVELEESQKTLADLEADFDKTSSELEGMTKEDATLATQITTKEEELETLQGELQSGKESLSQMKDQFSEVGDIEAAKTRVEQLRSENGALSSRLASLNSEVSSAKKVAENLQSEIDVITKQNEDQQSGKVPANYGASISQVYSEWGFIVIGAGNQQRTAKGAILSVQRGGEEVAKVKVTDVFPNRSIADVVRGSLTPGVTLRAGDRLFPAQ